MKALDFVEKKTRTLNRCDKLNARQVAQLGDWYATKQIHSMHFIYILTKRAMASVE